MHVLGHIHVVKRISDVCSNQTRIQVRCLIYSFEKNQGNKKEGAMDGNKDVNKITSNNLEKREVLDLSTLEDTSSLNSRVRTEPQDITRH